jgi:hypothetical protein
MKPVIMENKFTHERFICDDVRKVEVIEGVEYVRVRTQYQGRSLLMRRDALQRVRDLQTL